MRTHTIPQNVTSYEDKLVGMLIGKQFVYLAIGGVIIFVLLSSSLLPVPIAMMVSLIIGAWSAAMALLKIGDRPFDILFMSYMKAVLGPTEWAWHQEELPMRILVQPDAPISTKAVTVEPDPQTIAANNRRRVSQFEQYLDKKDSDLDDAEQSFLSRLNYSEDIPQSAFAAAKSLKAAPPMLTPNSPSPVQTPAKAEVQQYTPLAPKPLSPLASASGGPQVLVSLGSQEREVALMSNQRANRSLSRQLLSGGSLPLPVRGELSVEMPSDLKQELTGLIGFAPAGAPLTLASTAPVRDTGSTALPVAMPTAAQPVMTAELPLPAPKLVVVEPVAPTPVDPVVSQPKAPAPAAVQVEPVAIVQEVTPEPKLVVESQPPVALQLAPLPMPDLTATPMPTPADPEPLIEPSGASEAELNQVAEHVDSQIADQQQAHPLPPTDSANQLSTDSGNTKSGSAIPFKLHETGLVEDPIKQVRPILNTIFDEPTATPTSEGVAPLPASALDIPAAPAPVVVPASVPSDKTVPLTSNPNVVNGTVLDATGQFIAGVVVVVKDTSGEPKRALKTNKLGQFVILTPLPDGTYTVEVDKKGLAFDILQVQLNGAVPPPIEIKAKV